MTFVADNERAKNVASHSAGVPQAARGAVPHVAYCVYREALTSVFSSQVLVPRSLQRKELNVRVAVLTPMGHLYRRHWRQKLDDVARRGRELGVDISWLTSPPTRAKWLIDDVKQLKRWVGRTYGAQPVVLHCRNALMTQIALTASRTLPNVRVIFDCRGAEVAEFAQQQGIDLSKSSEGAGEGAAELAALQAIVSEAATRADHVTCVSHAMKSYLMSEYDLEDVHLSVIPCCLQTNAFNNSLTRRDPVRTELGLEDRCVVVYCGSLAWYQFPQQSLRMVRLLRDRVPRMHFLAITTQPEEMRREIASAGLPAEATTVLSVPPADVPRYLVAGDVALLLRDGSLVNRVASPVKTAEYLAAGLPMIISRNLGDYSQAVQDQGLGTVVDIEQSDDQIGAELSRLTGSAAFADRQMSARCRAFAADHLSWPRHLHELSQVYRRLFCESQAAS